MPTLTLKIYCDSKPKNLVDFEAVVQETLLSMSWEYVLVKTDYSSDESEIEDLLELDWSELGEEDISAQVKLRSSATEEKHLLTTDGKTKLRLVK